MIKSAKNIHDRVCNYHKQLEFLRKEISKLEKKEDEINKDEHNLREFYSEIINDITGKWLLIYDIYKNDIQKHDAYYMHCDEIHYPKELISESAIISLSGTMVVGYGESQDIVDDSINVRTNAMVSFYVSKISKDDNSYTFIPEDGNYVTPCIHVLTDAEKSDIEKSVSKLFNSMVSKKSK